MLRWAAFFGLAIGGCLTDLATKHWVFQWRGLPVSLWEGGPRHGDEWWLIEGYVGIETALNTGALFGMGQGKAGIFALLSVIAALGVLWWFLFGGAARDRRLTAALGCILAGILGNLYDRLGFWATPDVPLPYRYAVRDWILLRYGEYTWPNFNIADSLLVCGAALLIWHAVFPGHSAPLQEPATHSDEGSRDFPASNAS